jgi:hypothetical protein
MSISRISKAIAEVRGDKKFQDALDVRNQDIDVYLPQKLTDTHRLMARTATALILRCFKGKIRFHLPALDAPLFKFIKAEASKMGSMERLDFKSSEAGPWRLALGCRENNAICADASGWTARINDVFADRKPGAPPAITFAVSCAFAKLFNCSIFRSDRNAFEIWDFCLLRFLIGKNEPVDVSRVDLGRIGLLGAGGIGSAVGYVLSLSNWFGLLEIIDFDYFEEPNLETCLMASVPDVNKPLRKAASLAKYFRAHTITSKERDFKVEAEAPILAERWDAFVCGVDNPETRLTLDNVNAGILLNAGLGATREDVGWVLYTRHLNGIPPLSAIYKASASAASLSGDDVPEEYQAKCLRKDYQGISLALPFVGLAAGSLLASGIYQQSIKQPTTISSIRLDLFAKQQRMTIFQRD